MNLMELVIANPKTSIALISIIVTLVSTLIQKWLTNQEHLKTLKNRQKEIQKELKKCKDTDVIKELNAELLKLTLVMFKSSLKPMFVTIIPFLLLFNWLRGIYTPVIGGVWIWYYIGYSIAASMLFRKILKVA